MSTMPQRAGAPQLRFCPKCGAQNMLNASYCLACGEFLPPPMGHPSYSPMVPQPQPETGLSVPVILLIISALLLVFGLAFFLIAFTV